MRTTLSLDDDVALQLRRLQRDRGETWKDVVNSTLRAGLAARATPGSPRRRPARTKPVRLGGPVIGDIGNVHEVLSLAEGDARR